MRQETLVKWLARGDAGGPKEEEIRPLPHRIEELDDLIIRG